MATSLVVMPVIVAEDADIVDSAVSRNASQSHGGGIYSDDGSVSIETSTVSGNDSGANGGGIRSRPAPVRS